MGQRLLIEPAPISLKGHHWPFLLIYRRMAESAQEGRIIFACQFYGSPSTPLKLASGLICPSMVGNGQGLAESTPDPRPTQNLACLGSCPFYKVLWFS